MERSQAATDGDRRCPGTVAQPSDGTVMASIFEHCHLVKDGGRQRIHHPAGPLDGYRGGWKAGFGLLEWTRITRVEYGWWHSHSA